MTRRERERVSRAAAFVAIGAPPVLDPEDNPERWAALGRWRGEPAPSVDQPTSGDAEHQPITETRHAPRQSAHGRG
jgi:hypothetical protein